jgi:hypothetical protein
MATFVERTALELQQLKFGASSKARVAFSDVQRHSQKEGIALHGRRPSLALRSSAVPVFSPAQAPASLAPPTVQRLASRCARNERREVKVSTVSATKGWQRIGRSNTMRQRAQSPACSSKQA